MTLEMTSDVLSNIPAHTAVLLSEDFSAQREPNPLLARLRADVAVEILDARTALQREVARLRPALSATEQAEPTQWAWYPWRRALVSVLGPAAFRRVRLDRNRNKITAAEQDGFRSLTIGVVGLSVGHSIAHTLALEGLCGRLRLADNDTIELSNLNRIPATILDLGVNKAVVVARRVAELDPYLPVEVFPGGLTEDSLSDFFDGLDLVIEECDSLDMKLRVREVAKARGIPVLMETSDRGLFDVERFDLEPDRELFHGLLGDVEAASLTGLSTHDKAPHVMRILQTRDLSARMAASMVEIDQTVLTWPQLAGDVQLGGATVAAAVRRFGRGEPLPSGRVRVDLDTVLDGLAGTTHDDRDTVTEPVDVDLTQSIPAERKEAMLHAIRLAPSGGNSQPWSIAVAPEGIDIALAAERTSAMDVAFRGSYVSIGAAAFNARVAAAHHGAAAAVEAFPKGVDAGPVASVRIDTAPTFPGARGARVDRELAGMYPAMINRVSNRNFGRRRSMEPAVSAALHQDALAEGGLLHLITDPAALDDLAEIIAESDRIRYLTPLLHGQMMSEMRWPSAERADLGIDVRTLGLDAADLAKLEVASRADVMAQLADWGVGRALGDNTRDRIHTSSAVGVITVHGGEPADFVRGGMALERVWVRADRNGLAVHPVSPVFLYARSEADFRGLSPRFAEELESLQRRFNRTVGLSDSEVAVLVFRLSHDAAPPGARSQRLDQDDVLLDVSTGADRHAGG